MGIYCCRRSEILSWASLLMAAVFKDMEASSLLGLQVVCMVVVLGRSMVAPTPQQSWKYLHAQIHQLQAMMWLAIWMCLSITSHLTAMKPGAPVTSRNYLMLLRNSKVVRIIR